MTHCTKRRKEDVTGLQYSFIFVSACCAYGDKRTSDDKRNLYYCFME